MTGGSAPVCVHDIAHALAASYAGTRPRPVSPGESAMVCVPVLVVVKDGAERIEIAPCYWALVPYVCENRDPEKLTADGTGHVPVGYEQKAALVLYVKVPAGYHLVKDALPADDVSQAEIAPRSRTGIPELDAVDPAVFAINPERLNENIREMNERTKCST